MFVAWQDARDGVADIYLQRFTVEGTVAPGWPEGGLGVCTARGVQDFPRLTADGTGGVFAIWEDERGPTYVQRVGADGIVHWAENGIPLMTGVNLWPFVISDGFGGLIGVWQELSSRGRNNITLAIRLDAEGARVPGWPDDGLVVCSSTSGQVDPAAVSDGQGGAIFTWLDGRGSSVEVYATRVSGAGEQLWFANGRPLSTTPNGVSNMAMVTDGSGGAIVLWDEDREYPSIHVQRLSPTGEDQWAAGGMALLDSVGRWEAYELSAISDGLGGAVFAWLAFSDSYAQRVDALGALAWGSEPVAISTDPDWQRAPAIVGDGAGGAFMTWGDVRQYSADPSDVHVQRFAPSGGALWGERGLIASNGPGSQSPLGIVTDGASGILVAWADGRNSDFQILAQRFGGAGQPLWIAEGNVVFQDPGLQRLPTVVADGSGGSIIVWTEKQTGGYQIRAKKFGSDGSPLWPSVRVSDEPSTQGRPICVSDGQGGFVAVWTDARASDHDIYAQRVDASGERLWGASGAPVYVGERNQFVTSATGDGSGGAFVGWSDAGYYSYVYAQRLDGHGIAQWSPDGVLMSDSDSHRLMLSDDGNGGVIAVWQDSRILYYGGYAQHLDEAGNPMWASGGNVLGFLDSPSAPGLYPTGVVVDGAGGVIALARDGRTQVRAQRVRADGTLPWGMSGVALNEPFADSAPGPPVPDGSGGAIAVWSQSSPTGRVIRASRVGGSGATLWGPLGIRVADTAGSPQLGGISGDGHGGVIVSWVDEHENSTDVFAQRIDSGGAAVWGPNGIAVSAKPHGQYEVSLASDGGGGGIAAWTDDRSGRTRYIFAQHLTGEGRPAWHDGGVAIALASLESADVNDHGVRIVWTVAAGAAAEAHVYRSIDEGTWARIARAAADATGRVTYEDAVVKPGTRVGYRLGIDFDGQEWTFGEVWLDVQGTPTLALAGFWPNPTSTRLTVAFTLASSEPARLEVFDVSGRMVAAQQVGSLGPGTHVLDPVQGRRLEPGLYLLRLRQGARSVCGRGIVIR